MLYIVRVADVVLQVKAYGPATREAEGELATECRQAGIPLVSLGIEVERIDRLQSLSRIASPGEELEMLDRQGQRGAAAYLDIGVAVDAEATAEVVVTLKDIVVVGEASPEEYSIEVDLARVRDPMLGSQGSG